MPPKHAGSTDTIFAIFVDTTVWVIDTSKYCTTGYYFLVCLLASAVRKFFCDCASPHWQHTTPCDWAKKASLWCPSLSSCQTDKQTWLIAWFLQLFCFCNVSIFSQCPKSRFTGDSQTLCTEANNHVQKAWKMGKSSKHSVWTSVWMFAQTSHC